MTSSPLDHELEVATRLAREAAHEILRVKTSARKSAREKEQDQGPVTEADLAADRIVHAGLKKAFPKDLIITEERWKVGEEIARAERTWFVDPLDGTEDFVRGGDDYAVMIGLCVGGDPVLGVVVQPETGLAWRGVCLPGTRRCERVEPSGNVFPLDLKRRRTLPKEGPRAAVSRSHPSRLVAFLAGALGVQVVKKGSVGLKIGLIVDGKADLYVSGSRRIKVWDTAGPQAILVAAGGTMTALDGRPLRYDGAAAHDGVRAWTPAAAKVVGPRLEEALARWKAMNG